MRELIRRAAIAGEKREGTKVLAIPLMWYVIIEAIQSNIPGAQILAAMGTAAIIAFIFMEWRAWQDRNTVLDRPSTLEMIPDQAAVWSVMYALLLLAPLNMALATIQRKGGIPRDVRNDRSRNIMLRNILMAWLAAMIGLAEIFRTAGML